MRGATESTEIRDLQVKPEPLASRVQREHLVVMVVLVLLAQRVVPASAVAPELLVYKDLQAQSVQRGALAEQARRGNRVLMEVPVELELPVQMD